MAENFKKINSPAEKSRLKFILLFGAVTLLALPTAYFQVFSLFPFYDDEGYLMMTVKQFLDGKILYDEVYTQYGAAFYFFQSLIHLTGLPITHNAVRLTTVVMWILIALLGGVFTSRLTRSALTGAAAYLLTFLILFRTAYEPGHPQEFCGLLIVCGLLLLTGKLRGRNFDVRIFLLGAVVALLFLTKINLGIFFGAALAMTFVAFSAKNRLQQSGLIFLMLATMAMPFVLFRNFLAIGWFRFSVLIAVNLFATLLTSLLKTKETIFNFRHYLLAAAGFCLTATAVFLATIIQGTSPEAFLYGVFLQHLKFGDSFFQPAPIQRFAGFWAIFALITALAVLRIEKKKTDSAVKINAFLKLFFGLCVALISFVGFSGFFNVFIILSFATPFLWVVLLNSNHSEESRKTILPRLFLVLTATLQPLQIFPIAGTQMNYGAFLMLIIAAVCLYDAFAELIILLPNLFVKRKLKIALVGFLIITFAAYSIYRIIYAAKTYQTQIPLSFNGADRVHLIEEDYALYNFLVENLKADCDNFVSLPGLYSLHFWTNIAPPTTYNTTAALLLLDDRQQQVIVEKMKTYERGCAILNFKLNENGFHDKDWKQKPLSNYFLSSYQPLAELRDWTFMSNRNRLADLTYYAKFGATDYIEFYLPPRFDGKITRIQIYDWQQKQILADSRENPAILNEFSSNAEKNQFRYISDETVNPTTKNKLLLRLFDADGKIFASLPFPTQ